MLCRKQEHLDRLILGGLICLRHQLLEKSFVACDSAPEVCPPFLQCKSLIPSARKRKRRSERARQRRSRSRTYLSSFDAPSRLVVHCQLMGLAFVSVPVYQWRHSSTSHMFADASGLPRAALQLGFLSVPPCRTCEVPRRRVEKLQSDGPGCGVYGLEVAPAAPDLAHIQHRVNRGDGGEHAPN